MLDLDCPDCAFAQDMKVEDPDAQSGTFDYQLIVIQKQIDYWLSEGQ